MMRTLYILALAVSTQVAMATDVVAQAVPVISENQVFDNTGTPARDVAIDASTGEPVAIAPSPADSLEHYRAQFKNAKTAKEMDGFIAQYKNNDPDQLVPRAKIRMSTFAAFEAARNAKQCAEAKKLHQKITGYKVTRPFSYQDCVQQRSAQSADPQAMYVSGVRLEDAGDQVGARSQFRKLLALFPQHPLAVKAADRLAHLTEIETLEAVHSGTRNAASPADCPKDLGYLRSRMVFAELRQNASFAEPIEDIIRRAGGLDAAITEVQRLMQANQRTMDQFATTAQRYQHTEQDDVQYFRCQKPEGDLCAANYYYHLLREGDFYYAELLNSLRCRKTGEMLHAWYVPAPIQEAFVDQSTPATSPISKPSTSAETRP